MFSHLRNHDLVRSITYVLFLSLLVSNQAHSAETDNAKKMTIEKLKVMAFTQCQQPFVKPVTIPVPVLDPPANGGPEAVGMVYQEELEVRSQNLMDQDEFYISPRPRAAVNTLPMDIFVDYNNSGLYQSKNWEDARPDYSSNMIQPPIDKWALPAEGRVLTEVIIGHRSPTGDYPQLFDLRSSAYVRFAGFPPQITGSSLRLGAHKIFGLSGAGETEVQEDFPVIRSIYLSIKDREKAHAFIFLESDLFCGALSMDMSPHANHAEVIVDSFLYTRRDFDWTKDPHTGLAAYSSMLFRTEKNTSRISGEAHDADMLTVKYVNGEQKRFPLAPPSNGLRVRDLTDSPDSPDASEWILANEDQDPAHYADFYPALGKTNYDKRASYNVKILESNIKTGVSLYEMAADGEYGDNIVAVSTIRQDIKKANGPDQFVHFKYKTTAFYPNLP